MKILFIEFKLKNSSRKDAESQSVGYE